MAESRPAALPPAERTVGQLVAETIRLYGRRFWPSLALGLGPAVLGAVVGGASRTTQLVLLPTVGGVVLSATFVAAAAIVGPAHFDARRWALGVVAGVLAFAPFPFLVLFFVLPGLAWLALVGLVVPVVVLEGRPLRASFRRAVELARADFVHVLGSLATLAIVILLSQSVLIVVLQGQGDQALRVAAFLAGVVLSPVMFLGAALLYFDQEARAAVGSANPRRRRGDADIHHAHDADGAGSPDVEVEPRAAPRGQP
jgi:hypothetical protein